MMGIKNFFKSLGPGVITGAADDDPSGIATYSQAGAKFGYGLLWMALFMLPLQIAIQEACARIGAVTGKGISANLIDNKKTKTVYGIIFLLLIANIINIGADIGAMAAAVKSIIPLNTVVLMLFFTITILLLEIFILYRKYANFLKWLCLSLLAYPLTLFMIHVSWIHVLKATFIPHIKWNVDFFYMIVALLGTTISPYLFFWQASGECEEKKQRASNFQIPFNRTILRNIRRDNFIGMLVSEIAAWAIIVVTGTVLHANGVFEINSASDAARALTPLVNTFPHAGFIAKCIFAIGIVGLGLIAVPVLAASTAYAIGEAFRWKVGLNYHFNQAKGFYIVIAVSTFVGLFINFAGINPMKALVYAAIINGIIAIPLIVVIALVAGNKKTMGAYRSGVLSTVFIWLTFIAMLGSAIVAIALY